MWLSIVVSALGLVGIAVWGVLTQPPLNATFGIGITVLLMGVFVGLALRRHELDITNGSLVRAWGPGFRRSVPWQTARVRIVPNRGGQLMLAVRRPKGRATYIPLVADDLGGARSQPAGFLNVLAGEIERGGHQAVAGRIRAQAEHLEAGGDVIGSPLHRWLVTPR